MQLTLSFLRSKILVIMDYGRNTKATGTEWSNTYYGIHELILEVILQLTDHIEMNRLA